MSLHELVSNLIDTLRRQATSFERFTTEMRKQREHFVAFGAKPVEGSCDKLQPLADQLLQLEENRVTRVRALTEHLGLAADVPVSELADALPAKEARILTAAAKDARVAATSARVENIVGTRLLRVSERVNSSILESLVGSQHKSCGYNEHARTKSSSAPSGQLISGLA